MIGLGICRTPRQSSIPTQILLVTNLIKLGVAESVCDNFGRLVFSPQGQLRSTKKVKIPLDWLI